jgi:hypothetical protein
MIPLELVTLLGSTLVGGALKIWGMKAKYKAESDQATLTALNSQAKITKDVREYNNKGFQWTRRFIAVTATVAIVALPIILPAFLYLFSSAGFAYFPITFGYTESLGGFWPFTEAKDVVKWTTVNSGILITPFHTHMMAAINGMYFGGSLVGSRS